MKPANKYHQKRCEEFVGETVFCGVVALSLFTLFKEGRDRSAANLEV